MKRRTIIIIVITLVSIATGAFAAVRGSADEKASGNEENDNADEASAGVAEAEPINIETTVLEPQSLTEYVTARGITEASVDVTFSAEIAGKVKYMGPALGERVEKGEVLARIDLSSLWAHRNRARASYELAEKTHSRLSNLGADIVTGQKIDEAGFSRSSARAELTAINADLSKGVVRSTVSGVVTAKYVEESEFVAPGTPLFRVVDFGKIVVEGQLPETQVKEVAVGDEVRVEVDALGTSLNGSVTAILPAADPVSHTFTVRVEVPNTDQKVLIGMAAQLRIDVREEDDALMVVQDTIVEGEGGRGVFVEDGGVARFRPVQVGVSRGDLAEITDGLSAGDRVVVLGQRYLSDGQPVRVVSE